MFQVCSSAVRWITIDVSPAPFRFQVRLISVSETAVARRLEGVAGILIAGALLPVPEGGALLCAKAPRSIPVAGAASAFDSSARVLSLRIERNNPVAIPAA